MSFSPRSERNACMACEARCGPVTTKSSNARAVSVSHFQVSLNALIWAAARERSCSANRTL